MHFDVVDLFPCLEFQIVCGITFAMNLAASTAQVDVAATSSSRAWEVLTPSLAEWVLDAVSSMGLKRMTPVQASTIPLFMGHKDVVVEVIYLLVY
jgi:superfamily II DNA/RNA helicase